jgi:hypothetical protein
MGLCFTNTEDKINFDALIAVVGEKAATQDFVEYNKVRTPKDVLDKLKKRAWDFTDPRVSTLERNSTKRPSSSSFATMFRDIIRTTNQRDSIEGIKAMSERLGIPYQIVSLQEAKGIANRVEFKGGGFYKAGTVYLIDGLYNSDSVLHEFAHPIVKALAKYNPEVFESLLSEIPQEFTDRIKDLYVKDYNLESDEFSQEVLVQYIEQMDREESKKPKTLAGKIMYHLKQILRKLFGRKINLNKLSTETTLSEFLGMLNYGKEFLFDREFLTEDDFVYLQNEFYKIDDRINQETIRSAQELVNEMFSMVESQIKSFENTTGPAVLVKDLFVNEEDNKSALQVMYKTLKILKAVEKEYIPGETTYEKGILKDIADLSEDKQIILTRLNDFIHQISQMDSVIKEIEPAVKELSNLNIKDEIVLEKVYTLSQYLDNYNEFLTKALKNTYLFEVGREMPVQNRLFKLQSKIEDLLRDTNDVRGNIAVDLLYDHIVDKTDRADKFYQVQLDLLKESGNTNAYNKLYAEYNGLLPQEMLEYNNLKGIRDKGGVLTQDQTDRYKELTEARLSAFSISRDEFKDILTRGSGQTGWAWINRMFESYSLNQDKVTGGFYSYVQKNMDKINADSNARQVELLGPNNQLKKLLKKAGYGSVRRNFNNSGLGRAIGTLHEMPKYNPKEKDFDVEFEWRFKSNYLNFDSAIKQVKVRLTKAKEQYEIHQTDKLFDDLMEIEEELFYLKKDYWNQEAAPEFYDNEELLYKDKVGRLARKALHEIYDEINEIGDEIQVVSDINLAKERADKFRDLVRLRSTYENGVKKTGEALAIAERLQEYQKGRMKFFESSYNDDIFNAQYKEAIEDAENRSKGNEEMFHTIMDKWLAANTQVSIEDSYYDLITNLVSRKKALLAPLDELNDRIKSELKQEEDVDIDEEYEKIKNIIKPTRDDAGEYNGDALSVEEQQIVRDAHDTLERWRKVLYTASGITGEEFEYYITLTHKIHYSGIQSFSQEQREDYENMRDRLTGGLILYR